MAEIIKNMAKIII